MAKKEYCKNEGLGLAQDRIKVCQMPLYITTKKVAQFVNIGEREKRKGQFTS